MMEYPRPQFERQEWVSLDGEWTYHIVRRAFFQNMQNDTEENICSSGFPDRIIVPFAPETKLSGADEKEIIRCVFYHRKIQIPSKWSGKRIMLHFEAVFYHAEIYINGNPVGFHDGGSTPFAVDITSHVHYGQEYDLVVKATADLSDGSIPSGKQSSFIQSYACFYQRTTGIWQSVWMEPVDRYSLKNVRMIWSEEDGNLVITPEYLAEAPEGLLSIRAVRGGRVYQRTAKTRSGLPLTLHIDQPELWEPGQPNLYDIEFTVAVRGEVVDRVSSYIGLRTVSIEGGCFLLNGKKLYQRLVLDQGFYPESNWTAPSEQSLVMDIELSMKAGFNGARLHQKVFSERYLYHADRLGYLVWGESPSWGLDYNSPGLPARNFLSEWREIVERDINHPCIIVWTPLNETYLRAFPLVHCRLHQDAYELTKAIDPSRPVNDASGYIHCRTDIWTVHLYEQDPERFDSILTSPEAGVYRCYPESEPPYEGQPYFVDEFGGIKWDPETQGSEGLSFSQNMDSWGYGQSPRDIEAFYARLEGLVDALIAKRHVSGYCYTQLTDVEQEKNGLYYYDRSVKFDMDRIRRIFSRKPDWAEI